MALQIRWSNSPLIQAYKFNSAKLKPFRTTVIGYTGQMQNPGIREWKYSQEDHIEVHHHKFREWEAYWQSSEELRNIAYMILTNLWEDIITFMLISWWPGNFNQQKPSCQPWISSFSISSFSSPSCIISTVISKKYKYYYIVR